MTDVAGRGGQHRTQWPIELGALEVDVAHSGADREALFVPRHLIEAGNCADVDDDFRPGQAKVHHRNQALPAGQDLGFVSMGSQKIQDFGHIMGPLVPESCGLHSIEPSYDRP